MNNRKSYRPYGFTIVELLVVIVVIGILATIVIVSYRGISAKAIEASIVSDLDSSSKKLKMHILEDDTFPADISELSDCPTPATGHVCLKLSASNSLGRYYVNNATNPRTFCLTVKSTNTAKSITHDSAPIEGSCPPSNFVITARTLTSISLSWDSVPDAISYTMQSSNTPDFASHTDITTTTGVTTATASGLVSGIYYFRVNAIDASGASAWSATVSASTQTVVSYTTPGSYTWTVPLNTTSVQLEAWGGQGGNGGNAGYSNYPGGVGGLGGYGKGILSTTPGQSLSINVGQSGINGSNGSSHVSVGSCYTYIYGGSNGTNGTDSSIKLGDVSEVIGYGGTGGTGGTADATYDPDWGDYCYPSYGSGVNGSNGVGYANTSFLTSYVTNSGQRAGNGKVTITY